MPSKLKTLILPQLVEQRRQSADSQQSTITSLDGVDGTSIFLVDNTSLSDITSPVTPTFSHRSGLGHLRGSSSTSSLDLPLSLSMPAFAPECPVPTTSSPTSVPPGHSSTILGLANGGLKRQLADVQEEGPLERDEEENRDEEQVNFDIEYANDVSQEYRNSYLYGCLCDTPCNHGQSQDYASSAWPSLPVDHDPDFPTDDDVPIDQVSPLSSRPCRTDSAASAMMVDGTTAVPDSSFSGLTQRFGSRIHALSRWRSNSARSQNNNFVNLIGAPASAPTLSRAPSSQRSSLSARRPKLRNGNSVDEQSRFPPTSAAASGAMSFYGSSESVAYTQTPTTRETSHSSVTSIGMSSPTGAGSTGLSGLMIDNNEGHDDDDDENDDVNDLHRDLERERSLATTPLLPPLFISNPPPPVVSPLPPASLQVSPLSSPGLESPVSSGDAIADRLSTPSENLPSPAAMSRLSSQDVLPSPPLQKKASTSSFLHPYGHTATPSMGMAKAAPATTAPPPTLEPHDEWSDRLGHANYTIVPKPPVVSAIPASMDATDAKASVRQLRADWSQARINYTKHLVRVGEHYGTTSTTYVLTDAKWAETEREWKTAHDALREQLSAALKKEAVDGTGSPTDKTTDDDDAISLFPPRHDMSLMVPQLIDGEGKFPHRGDEDIVGPMDRATVMVMPQKNARASVGPVSGDDGRMSEEKRKMIKFWRSLTGRVRLSRK